MPVSRRTARALVTLGVVAGLGGAFIAGAAVAGDPSDPQPRFTATTRGPQPVRVSFTGGAIEVAQSCDKLLSWYVERGVDRVSAYGWGGPPVVFNSYDAPTVNELGGIADHGAQSSTTTSARAPAAARTTRSTNSATGTNVQEAGVDEPDVVKTDGSILVRVQGSELTTYDVTGAEVRRLGSLDLPDLGDAEILLDGDTVVAIGTDTANAGPDDEATTRVLTVDVSDPADPAVTDSNVYDTTLVSARQYGDTIRLLLSAGLPDLDFVRPARHRGERSALQHNRRVVRESTIENWLPTITTGGSTEQLLGCDDVALPTDDAGLGTLALVGFDAGTPGTWSATGLAVDSDLAYFSQDHVYLATPAYSSGWVTGCCLPGGFVSPVPTPTPGSGDDGTSHIYDFGLEGTTATFLAAGDVDGQILDRWAMDEYAGVLRVAVAPTQRTGNFNSIVTFERDGNDLVEKGRIDRLGVNEQLRSMRWFDGLAVLVTFRQTDPLYAVDLTRPARPRLLGRLEVPGYSEYLHPLGSLRLVGIGQGPGPRGAWGAQAGLFNVANPAHTRRLDAIGYRPGTVARAATDPRQFTWLPQSRTVLTVISSGYGGRTGWVSVLSLHHGTMTNRMVRAEYGDEIDEVRLVPEPDGRVVLLTGDGASFFELRS
jgi:hypothetical protein